MKVLHINTAFKKGGAAIAAYRHCEAMSKSGIKSQLLSLSNCEPDNKMNVCVSSEKKIELYKAIQTYAIRFIRKKVVWTSLDYGYNIIDNQLVKEADYIYIHWIDGFLNFQSIESLLKTGKPIIWFMHDMGAFTGGCHYSFDCKGYESNCNDCPQLRFLKFLTKNQLEKKIRTWGKYGNFYLAAPSNWLAECIRRSSLFKKNKVFVCPNVIDTTYFRPINKEQVRQDLRLPVDRKLILFSAMGLNNPYKGIGYLFEALSKIDNPDYECLVLGLSQPEMIPSSIKIKMHLMGYINDQGMMLKIYNSANVLIIPSLAENFPNVVLEAMACGVPAVGFATGGIVDQIEHKKNGYLVDPKNVDGLVEGIDWVLNSDLYNDLADNARNYVLNNCSYNNVLDIHKEILAL